jgi:hypothetical protein
MGDAELLPLNEALEALALHDPRKAERVKPWSFVELSLEPIAAVPDIWARTADRDLAYARLGWAKKSCGCSARACFQNR